MEYPALPICPKCKQTDQVQKVTSIHAANTKEWKETSTGIDSWGNTVTTEHLRQAHTSLGLKLKLPDKPAGPIHPGLWYGIGGLVVFILASILCPLALVPFSFIVPLAGAISFIPNISGLPAWAISAAVIGLPTLCFILIGLGLLIWLGSKIKTRFEQDMKNYKDKKAVFDRDELPRWQHAKARWEQLYFCMRDETLFIPAENKAVKAEDMEKYLYDPQFRS